MRSVTPVLCVLCAVLFLTGASGYITVPAENLFSTQNSSGRTIGCAVVNGKVISGKISAKGFLPESATIKNLLAKLRKKISAKQKAALKKKIALAKKAAKANAASCKAELNGEPTPTPSGGGGGSPPPGATRTPTPRPTSTPASGGCFTNGNTTRFGIPSGTTGNVSRGSGLWSSRCASCHGEKTNRTFGQISTSMSLPQMAGLNMSTQQLADLTAYLNRNNTRCN